MKPDKKKKRLYIFCLFGLILFIPFVLAGYDLDKGLEHYYNLSVDLNDSRGAVDGVNSGATQVEGCVEDGCFYFDTNDHIQFDGIERFHQTDAGSFCMWVNHSDDSNFRTYYSEGCNNDICIYAFRQDNDGDGKPRLFVRNTASSVLEDVEFNNVTANNAWNFLCYVKNATTNSYNFYVNSQVAFTGDYADGGVSGTFDRATIGALRFTSAVHLYNNRIDEFGVWNRTLNDSEILMMYNGSSGNYCNPLNNPTGCEAPPPVVSDLTVNTTIRSNRFPTTSVDFATDEFFNAYVLEFNTTATRNMTLLNSFNTEKLTGGSANNIFVNVKINSINYTTELIRSVSGFGAKGVTSFKPLNFISANGNNNITVQFRRTGVGTIRVDDADFLLIQHTSLNNNAVDVKLINNSITYTSTDYKRNLNFTVYNNSNYFFTKLTLTSSATATTDLLLSDTINDVNSSRVTRYITDASSIGSAGLCYIDNQTAQLNYSFLSKTNVGTVTANYTIFSMNLVDKSNNTIRNSYNTNASSTNEGTLNINAGLSKLTQLLHPIKNGNSVFISGSVSFGTTSGAQTPEFIIDSDNASITCDIRKQRSLANNNDIGNVFIFGQCNNLNSNSSYIFNLKANVSAGETLVLYDEGLTVIDSTSLSLAVGDGTPVINMFTGLVNKTANYNQPFLNVTYNYTVGLFNTIDTANCTLIVDGVVNATQLLRNDSIDYVFNYDTSGLEKNQSFRVECTNFEANASTGLYWVNIDTVLPQLNISVDGFLNNSVYNKDATLTLNFSFVDTNIFAYNITIRDANGNLWNNENYFAENITGVTQINNVTSRVLTDTGNYTIFAQAWDSHTDFKVRGMSWKFEGNDLIADDSINFSGDLKQFNNNNDLVTYFYLSEKGDRYKLKLTFGSTKLQHEIVMETKRSIFYIPNSNYMGHFVYFNGDIKRWIDFESENIESVSVTKLSDNKYRILLNLYSPSDEIEIESIGDLNTNSGTWFYTVQQITTVSQTNITGLEESATIIATSINMFWFWLILLFSILLPFIIEKMNPNNRIQGFVIASILFMTLLFINITVNYFSITDEFKRILNIVLFSLSIMYAMIGLEGY